MLYVCVRSVMDVVFFYCIVTPTSGGAVTAVTNCCVNCVEPSRPQK